MDCLGCLSVVYDVCFTLLWLCVCVHVSMSGSAPEPQASPATSLQQGIHHKRRPTEGRQVERSRDWRAKRRKAVRFVECKGGRCLLRHSMKSVTAPVEARCSVRCCRALVREAEREAAGWAPAPRIRGWRLGDLQTLAGRSPPSRRRCKTRIGHASARVPSTLWSHRCGGAVRCCCRSLRKDG